MTSLSKCWIIFKDEIFSVVHGVKTLFRTYSKFDVYTIWRYSAKPEIVHHIWKYFYILLRIACLWFKATYLFLLWNFVPILCNYLPCINCMNQNFIKKKLLDVQTALLPRTLSQQPALLANSIYWNRFILRLHQNAMVTDTVSSQFGIVRKSRGGICRLSEFLQYYLSNLIIKLV